MAAKVTCDICGSEELAFIGYDNHNNKLSGYFKKKVFLLPFKKIISLFSPGIAVKLLFSPLYKIRLCKKCGYGIYDRPGLGVSELSSYYETAFWIADGQDPRALSEDDFLNDDKTIGQFAFISEHLQNFILGNIGDKTFKVLEIGAGRAFPVQYLRYNHPNTQVHVVEAGRGWVEYYRYLDIHQVSNFFPFKHQQKYHFITSTHWLEHMEPGGLNETILCLKEMLEPGGWMYISLPLCNDEYWAMNRRDTPHIHFFTKNSLARLLTNHGFSVEKVGVFGSSYLEHTTLVHPMTAKKHLTSEDTEVIRQINASKRGESERETGADLRMLVRLP